LSDGKVLSPENPVTLRWDNGQGLVFTKTFEVDDNFMFTVTQRVENTGSEKVSLYPYGLISRTGTPSTLGFYILHEGPLGVFDGTWRNWITMNFRKNTGSPRPPPGAGWG
jgi:YidC/Oxa1 family membrane protein insertase